MAVQVSWLADRRPRPPSQGIYASVALVGRRLPAHSCATAPVLHRIPLVAAGNLTRLWPPDWEHPKLVAGAISMARLLAAGRGAAGRTCKEHPIVPASATPMSSTWVSPHSAEWIGIAFSLPGRHFRQRLKHAGLRRAAGTNGA